MFVNATPVLPVHDIKHAPENLLLILNVHQEHTGDEVHSLNITNLTIIITISNQDIEKHILAALALPIEVFALTLEVLELRWVVRKRTRDIFLHLGQVLRCRNIHIRQLLVHSLAVHGLLPITSAEHAPYLST